MAATFNFRNLNIRAMIDEAYSRMGVRSSLITDDQLVEAKRSMNLIFSTWLNQLNLWTVSQQMFSIIPGQSAYMLPDSIGDILDNEMIVANINRQLEGTATSAAPTTNPTPGAGGVAANAFDGNALTACTQTATNGYIAYDYGVGNQYSIYYVGIQSNAVNRTYTLTVQYSYDNITWYELGNILSQVYIQGQISWYVVPMPVMARSYRIVETGGSTLDIQELYFMLAPYNSHKIGRIARDTYLSYTNKSQQGLVNVFCYDRTFGGPVFLYLTPDNSYQFIIYNMKSYVKDVNLLTDNDFLPQRFFDALCAELAARLSLKYDPDRFDLLNQLAQQAYNVAAAEDVETVPLTIDFEGWH